MNTYAIDLMGRRRRRHSSEFKAAVIQECMRPGVSVAAVALAHSLNANMLRRWVIDAESALPPKPKATPVQSVQDVPMPGPTFVRLALPAPAIEGGDIRIELQRGDTTLTLVWPVSAARDCAAWLRGLAAMIRVEAVWLCTEPMDMRAGTDTTLARVVKVFGAARPHHAYIFANRRSTRLKVLIHDGIGIWLAARRLHQGHFIWPGGGCGARQSLTREQLDALVVGLPWQRVGEAGVIRVV